MIYWLMALSLILLVVSTLFTYRDYMQGRTARAVFTKMRMITLLIGLLFIIVLVTDFIVFA
ncbi:MAG: hypothetical protein LBE35_02935 [Clostridiales bacterium]|jgi:heme/copper-type cytochrome/quinol oxidase subunit 3|nr:hypothetical protein [Clostridiales bacterium]